MGIKTIEDDLWQELLRLRQLEKHAVPALWAVWEDLSCFGCVIDMAPGKTFDMVIKAIESIGAEAATDKPQDHAPDEA